jgi:hypothetical protein
MFGNNDFFSGTDLVDVMAQLIFEFADSDFDAVVVCYQVYNEIVATTNIKYVYNSWRGESHWDDFDQFF